MMLSRFFGAGAVLAMAAVAVAADESYKIGEHVIVKWMGKEEVGMVKELKADGERYRVEFGDPPQARIFWSSDMNRLAADDRRVAEFKARTAAKAAAKVAPEQKGEKTLSGLYLQQYPPGTVTPKPDGTPVPKHFFPPVVFTTAGDALFVWPRGAPEAVDAALERKEAPDSAGKYGVVNGAIRYEKDTTERHPLPIVEQGPVKGDEVTLGPRVYKKAQPLPAGTKLKGYYQCDPMRGGGMEFREDGTLTAVEFYDGADPFKKLDRPREKKGTWALDGWVLTTTVEGGRPVKRSIVPAPDGSGELFIGGARFFPWKR